MPNTPDGSAVVRSSQQNKVLPIDWKIAVIAHAQHGVITAEQLHALPLGRCAVSLRERSGRLHRLHRGVYAVGHDVLTQEGRWLAAVLASGPDAALSHRSAAHHLGLIVESPTWITEVTARTRGRKQRRGIRLYETTRLTPGQFIHHRGIRTASPARAIADLAAVVPIRRVERAIGRAEVVYGLRSKDLFAAARYRKGAPVIRLILGAEEPIAMTRSDMEDLFFEIVERVGLHKPQSNVFVHGYESDFFFEKERLIVETDGDADHLARSARHRDRQRDARLTAAGYIVLRFGWEQVRGRPDEVAAALRTALRQRSAVVRSTQ